MSWQAYVDSSMIGSGHVDQGAIYSLAGDSKWAGSKGFEVSPPELQDIITGLKNPTKLFSDGLHVASVKYVAFKAEGRSIYGRKGHEGVVIVQTTQAILIAHYKEGMIAGNTATTIENLADYLIGLGY